MLLHAFIVNFVFSLCSPRPPPPLLIFLSWERSCHGMNPPLTNQGEPFNHQRPIRGSGGMDGHSSHENSSNGQKESTMMMMMMMTMTWPWRHRQMLLREVKQRDTFEWSVWTCQEIVLVSASVAKS